MSIKERIETIPSCDRIRIERLFQQLLWNDQFAYTLFGSKPMSHSGYPNVLHTYGLLHPSLQILLAQDWKVWERYQHLFPSETFALFSEQTPGWLNIYLINKTTVVDLVKKHLPLFEKKASLKETPKEFVNHLITDKEFLEKV